ncbi:NAD-binding protein [Amanita muscaria]
MSSTDLQLKGKLALITGCTGGIGSTTALTLARQGCSIAVHYNSAKEKADDLVAKLKDLHPGIVRAAAFPADLSTYDGARKLHAAVVREMGNPDILFSNAGVVGPVLSLGSGSIQDVSVNVFEDVWRTNAGTAFLLTQLCMPKMVERNYGRIIYNSRFFFPSLPKKIALTIISIAAGIGGRVGPHYSSSKAALHGLVHWIAPVYAEQGITCNAVAPAFIVETNMFSKPPDAPKLLQKVPVGRFGVPSEIASVVELLVTNGYMTNKIIVIDGGMTATGF